MINNVYTVLLNTANIRCIFLFLFFFFQIEEQNMLALKNQMQKKQLRRTTNK